MMRERRATRARGNMVGADGGFLERVKGEGFHRRKMMEDNGDKEPEVRAVI